MFNPKFTYTNTMVSELMLIEHSRAVVDLMPLPATVERDLIEKAKVKMTHYSTRIEGNLLDLEQVSRVVKQKPEKNRIAAEDEVRNYWEALSFLSREKKKGTPITEDFILRLHAIIYQHGTGRKALKSRYRVATGPGVLFAVFDNKTRQPEYIPPEYSDVPVLMDDFTTWIKQETDLPVPIKAAIAAYQLLTIHPFEDGNGRTARALATYMLSLADYDMKGFQSLEEYYVDDLDGYYRHLQMGLPVLYYDGRHKPENMAPWIEYFVKVMSLAYEKVANLAKQFSTLEQHALIALLEPNETTLLRFIIETNRPVKPLELAQLFQVHTRTIGKWTKQWVLKGLIEPAGGTKRITAYRIGSSYSEFTLADLGYKE
ncbi:Fic family protein [Sporosarcina sp. E16_8]|uniref:Fic family protein n=1 Tax=Sporosarcina sp. E16_8 TaxID=2789295 RepID=UPI001A92554D|nr:Fic family protein [Sporosarcina sp. E16_8]